MNRTKKRQLVAIGLLATATAGCANITSIDRWNSLPGHGDSEGKAIHLDAKQRLVISKKFGIVCAEPSPDAFTALASGFALGVTTPQQASISLANALAESGGTFGLRTQSITLMRDALYRVCEAYYGRALNQVMVMQLLQRYQNIMTAVLAIEQLTGAVTAPAVAAAKRANASASATLNDLQKQLEESLQNEKAKKDAAKAAAQTVQEKRQAMDTAEAKLKALPPDASETDKKSAQAAVTKTKGEWDDAQENSADADRMAKQTTEVRESISKARLAAVTSANASASGEVKFEAPNARIQLSDAATQHIATAVEKIVAQVFTKDYLKDSCLNFFAGYQNYQAKVAEANLRASVLSSDKAQEERAKVPQGVSEAEADDIRSLCAVVLKGP